MKKIIFALLLVSSTAIAQSQTICCSVTVSSQNAILAMNDKFANKHDVPEPFKLSAPKGDIISFETIESINGLAYYIKSAKPTNKVLFVFHEWWGLNDYIKQEAEIFATEMGDVDVYAIDLYDGQVATDVPTAQKLMSGLKQERATAIVSGIIAKVGADKSIATIGWCMGGAWSLQSTLLETKQAKACVMYYGMPEKNVERLKTLNCDVLGIFAKQDQFINPELVQNFEANMKAANKKLTVYNYNADHAFANPSNPKHNKEYAADAHAKALKFLTEKLK
ncbi:MAG: dienelactone hydrolase family protein [Bacteroidia bacterium]|nr:dienelactone hydrolase family protein [Bacteroidia bacterium]